MSVPTIMVGVSTSAPIAEALTDVLATRDSICKLTDLAVEELDQVKVMCVRAYLGMYCMDKYQCVCLQVYVCVVDVSM